MAGDVAATLEVDVLAGRETVSAALARLESQLERSDATAQRIAASLESKLARGQATARNEALSHAQALARLSAQTGDYAAAERGLSAAIAQAGPRTTAVIRAETQLAQIRRQAVEATRLSTATTQSFGSQLLSLAGPLGVATTGIGALIAVGAKVQDGFNLVATLEENRRTVQTLVGDVDKGNKIFDEAAGFARRYGFTQREMGAAAAAAAPLLRNSTVETQKQLEVLGRLASLNTAEGISGATFSVKELASGDITSIVERFNLGRDAARAMKDEIASGADVFTVLDRTLNQMGVTTDVLANRTLGAAGATRTYAQAQEDLSLALGKLAEGPGVKVLGFLSQFTTAVANAASSGGIFGNQEQQGQAIEGQLVAAATSYEDYKNRVTAAQNQINEAFAGDPIGNAIAQNIAGLGQLLPSQVAYAQSLIATGTAAADAVAKSQAMSDVATLLATQLNAVGGAGSETGQVLNSMSGQLLQLAASGQNGQDAVFALAGSYAAGEITAEQFRIVVEAQIASLDAQAQAAANAAALEAQRHGEQTTGVAATEASTNALAANTAALIEQTQKTLESSIQAQQLASFQERLASLGGAVASGLATSGAAAAALAKEYNLASGEAERLINLQAQLALVQQNRAALADQRAGERDGGSSRTAAEITLEANGARLRAAAEKRRETDGRKGRKAAGAAKLSDQARLNSQLLSAEEKAQQQLEDAERAHQGRLLEIEAEFQRRSLEQQRANETGKRGSRASFYRTLLLDTEGLSPQVEQSLSAAYEAAFAKSQELAQSGNAKLAADYLDLKQEQLEAETQFQADLAKAREDGDKDMIARLTRIRELEKQTEAEQEKQLLAGGDENVNARNEALSEEQRKVEEQQDKIGLAADRAGDRLVTNALRAGKSVSENLIPPLERAAGLVDRLGGSTATGTGAPGTTTTPTDAGAAAPNEPASIIETLRSMAQAIVDALGTLDKSTKDGTRAITGAIGSLRTERFAG